MHPLALTEKVIHPFQPPFFYEERLGPNKIIEAQQDFFEADFEGSQAIQMAEQVKPVGLSEDIAGNLLNKFHGGAMTVADVVPEIKSPAALWIELGEAPSPAYVVSEEHASKPAIVVTTDTLKYLSGLPQKQPIRLPAGATVEAFGETSYSPEEYMFALGVEEAHHAIIARYRGLKYGVGIGPVSPDRPDLYLAQDVEWQPAHFVLAALKANGASKEAIETQERRMQAALKMRKLIGLEDSLGIPYLDKFTAHHNKH